MTRTCGYFLCMLALRQEKGEDSRNGYRTDSNSGKLDGLLGETLKT